MKMEEKELVGVIQRLTEKSKSATGKAYTGYSALIVNLMSGVEEWFSGFGATPKEITEAFNGRNNNPPIEGRLTVSKNKGFWNYVKGSYKIITGDGRPKEINVKTPASLGADPDFPGADKLDYWHFIEGEMVSYARTGLKAFRGVFGREPKSDGEFRVMGNLMMFSAYHWPVELFKRSRGCKTVDELYKEALLKRNGEA